MLDLEVIRPTKEELHKLINKKSYDIYMMGCIVTGYRYVKSLCALIRKVNPSALIVVGNSVASSIPEILLNRTEADIAVFSEGDITVLDILDAYKNNKPWSLVAGIAFLENGEYKYTKPRPVIKNIDTLPFIDWEIFDIEFYNKKSPILVNEPCPMPYNKRVCMALPSARGCAFKCDFCYHVFREERYRYRSAKSIVKEVVHLINKYGINYVNFWDELTFPNTRHCEEVVDAFLEADLEIYWNATIRGDLFRRKDKPIAEKMRASGCIGVTNSIEHVDKEILRAMNKKLDVDRFLEQKYIMDEVGIATWTNLVIGYPQETKYTIRAAMDFCYEQDLYPSTGYLLPLPGTPVYEYALKHGYITDEENYLLNFGDRQDLHVNMTAMDDATMISATLEGLDRINKKLGIGLSSNSLIKTTVKIYAQTNTPTGRRTEDF